MKRFIALLATVLALTGCGYNDFQRLDEKSKAAWSEVLNQYQRRADLVPNIVATVKGEAAFEQDTLTRVLAWAGDEPLGSLNARVASLEQVFLAVADRPLTNA